MVEGDLIMATPIFRLLKRDGYHVTLNCNKRGAEMAKHNPYIDKVLFHDESIPNEDLGKHWAELGSKYDRVINLSESIEKGLLAVEGSPEFNFDHDERHRLYNHNYYDRTMEIAGYPEEKGLCGEMFFSPTEETILADFRKKYIGKFKVLWALSGSAHHKVWPYAPYVSIAFLNKHPDAIVVTVGDDICRMLEWDHPRTIARSGQWHIRKACLMAKYADLVISTETGIANAAACFGTPQITLLSHSSEENLTKYWKNNISLHTDSKCHPCHQLHYTEDTCDLSGVVVKGPVCMTELMPDVVFDAMEQVYEMWRVKDEYMVGNLTN